MKYEKLIIRPPSEYRSLLLRITRGCKWNRCLFCGIYPTLGEPDYSTRSINDIIKDISILKKIHPRATTAFLGDADPLSISLDTITEILHHLYTVFPNIERVTCYARATTLLDMSRKGILKLASAGLTRVHIGLESGDDKVLRFHKKGLTANVALKTAKWLKEAGIESSYYILLGLAGQSDSERHIDKTAWVLNCINPDFIRVRRLWLYSKKEGAPQDSPLWEYINSGTFLPQTPEGTVRELHQLLISLNNITSYFTCDHANNYVQVKGTFPVDTPAMINKVAAFLALPDEIKEKHYALVGSQI